MSDLFVVFISSFMFGQCLMLGVMAHIDGEGLNWGHVLLSCASLIILILSLLNCV